MVTAVILWRAAGVAEEQHVHHAALGDPRHILVEFGVVVGVADPRPGHPPEIVGVKEGEIGGEMNLV